MDKNNLDEETESQDSVSYDNLPEGDPLQHAETRLDNKRQNFHRTLDQENVVHGSMHCDQTRQAKRDWDMYLPTLSSTLAADGMMTSQHRFSSGYHSNAATASVTLSSSAASHAATLSDDVVGAEKPNMYQPSYFMINSQPPWDPTAAAYNSSNPSSYGRIEWGGVSHFPLQRESGRPNLPGLQGYAAATQSRWPSLANPAWSMSSGMLSGPPYASRQPGATIGSQTNPTFAYRDPMVSYPGPSRHACVTSNYPIPIRVPSPTRLFPNPGLRFPAAPETKSRSGYQSQENKRSRIACTVAFRPLDPPSSQQSTAGAVKRPKTGYDSWNPTTSIGPGQGLSSTLPFRPLDGLQHQPPPKFARIRSQSETITSGHCASTDTHRMKLEKPKMSYLAMIATSIMSVPDRQLLLADIYRTMLQKWPYFETVSTKCWKNTVRHTLSAHGCFVRMGRRTRTGSLWSIHPACISDFGSHNFDTALVKRRIREFGDGGGNSTSRTETNPSASASTVATPDTQTHFLGEEHLRPTVSCGQPDSDVNNHDVTTHDVINDVKTNVIIIRPGEPDVGSREHEAQTTLAVTMVTVTQASVVATQPFGPLLGVYPPNTITPTPVMELPAALVAEGNPAQPNIAPSSEPQSDAKTLVSSSSN